MSVVSQLNVTNGQPATTSGELQAMQMGYTNTGTPSANYGWIIATDPGSSYNNLCLNANQAGGTGAFLGVNTNNPQYTLDVNGNANIASNLTVGGSITTSSDYRLKTHVLPLQQTTHAIAPLRPVQYTMRQTNTTHFGFLAHELQAALPFLVRGEKDGRGIQTVDTMSLVALLVHEVQQLQQRVDQLENEAKSNRA